MDRPRGETAHTGKVGMEQKKANAPSLRLSDKPQTGQGREQERALPQRQGRHKQEREETAPLRGKHGKQV